MAAVIVEASELAGKIFPDQVPEWPEWMYWRDIHAVYSEAQLFRMGRVQAMCRLEGALYMIRHQAPNSVLMEEYRPNHTGSFPLFRRNHLPREQIWKKRVMKTWARPETHNDPKEPPPQEFLDALPGLIMIDALNERGQTL
jgi:hypothetical protein